MSKFPYYLYGIYRWLYIHRVPLLPTVMMISNRLIFGAYIPPSATIGAGTRFSYGGSGVVIHAQAIIGSGCTIGPGCTVGGRSRQKKVPVLGDRVYLGGGAKVLGNVSIGSDVVIGANAVVINDIPSNCVAVGVPAVVIRRGIDVADYV